MKVFLGRGDGTFFAWRRTFYPWPTQAVDVRDLRLADLDRDGLIDLVRFTDGHVLWFPGQADGSLSWLSRPIARPDLGNTDVTVAVTDANGNGSQDIVWSSPRGMWILDIAGATTAGMLSSIDNGLGKTMTIDYASSAELSVEAEQAGEPWARKLPVSVPVPVEATIDPGAGEPSRVVHYGVRDGFWDPVERRFGGFLEGRRSVSGDAGADVMYEVTKFLAGEGDDRVLRGKPASVLTENGLGQILTFATTQWAAHPVGDLATDNPLLRVAVQREVRTSHYEGVTQPIDTLAWYVQDAQGRVIEEHDDGRLDLQGDESVKQIFYAADDDDRWIRDRVCEQKLLAADGGLVSWTRTYFGDISGAEAPLCELGSGDALQRRTDGYLAEKLPWVTGSRWITLSAVTSYSAHWNPLEVYDSGVTRDLGYDTDDFHLVSESVTPAAGTTLTWSMAWDPDRSLPVSVTDPNSTTTEVTYDDVGRLATLGLSGEPASTHYIYDWTAPRPTTTTYVFDGDEADLDTWSGGYSSGAGWRETVAAFNGAGEGLYSATRLDTSRWLVSGYTDRDNRGRAVRLYDAFEWDASDLTGAQPPGGTAVEQRTYDAFDRPVQDQRPGGEIRQVAYFAFGRTITDDDLSPVTSYYDGKGRITRTERTVDGTVEAGQATYDAAGRMTELELQPDASNPTHHTFVYDTLGRLIFATDPDIGDRTLTYNDAGFLTEATNAADQSIDYGYDGAGRLVSVLADDGSFFNYHYDDALDSGTYANTAGRLAWISEPTGQVQVGYDARGRQVKTTREIEDGTTWTGTATEDMRFAPSGLLRSIDYNDGMSIDYTYDDAGRPAQVGNLWTAESYDPAGRLLAEQFGNGVTGAYGYDINGDVSSVEVARPSAAGGSPFYQVSLTRNGFGAIDSVTDADGTGLNHTASFTYDGAGRLTAATLGPATSQYQFSYSYDGLQNMIQRTASGPGNLGALEGDYRYGGTRPAGLGGGSYGPRQLTGIAPAGSDPMDPPDHTMAYDLAGRQVAQDDLTLTYNGLDQLTEVDGLSTGSGTVQHAYGYDGLRVMTRSTDGSTQYWFSTDVSQVGTVRQHSIRLGDRLIARVDQHDLSPNVVAPPVSTDGGDLLRRVGVALLLLLLVVVCAGFAASGPRARARGRRLAPATAAVAAAALLQPGCALLGFSQHPSWENVQTLYFHQGVSPGPTLITRQDGTLLEERRYEPFGQPLDAFRELEGGGTETGAVDFTVDPHNILNKETNPDTGWSYHGARWMAPETARWLTPDPPVKAPSPDLIAAPWTAHPYQYVLQNPIVFWDPDGAQAEDASDAEPSPNENPEVPTNPVDIAEARALERYQREVVDSENAQREAHWEAIHPEPDSAFSDPRCRWPETSSFEARSVLQAGSSDPDPIRGTWIEYLEETQGDSSKPRLSSDVEGALNLARRMYGGEGAEDTLGLSNLHTRGFRPPAGTRSVPEGIPEGWRIRPTRGEGGVRYYDPKNPGNAVRVMPGDPSSQYPNSQEPYVRWQRNGQALDADGNLGAELGRGPSHHGARSRPRGLPGAPTRCRASWASTRSRSRRGTATRPLRTTWSRVMSSGSRRAALAKASSTAWGASPSTTCRRWKQWRWICPGRS